MKLPDIIRRLQEQGWTVVKRRKRKLRLPREVSARHPKIPSALSEFLGILLSCENDTQTAWFLCEGDFDGTSGAAFKWDQWERMSLEAAADDPKLAAAVRGFWNEHLPFLLSVRDGYAYFAVRTAAKGFGRVIAGREPEFEEASEVARSVEDFLSLLADGGVRA